MNKKLLSPTSREIQEDIKRLVIARINASSDDLTVSIGSTEYTKKEMLSRVKKGDEIGQEIINIHMEYLKDMVEGTIYQ